MVVGGGGPAYGVIPPDGKNIGAAIPLSTFNTAGIQLTGSVGSMALAPDGGIVMAFGSTISGNSVIGIAKLTSTWLPDTGFGTGGFTSVGPQYVSSMDVAVRPNGKIVIGGSWYSPTANYMLQLDSKGAPDTTFGINGQVTTSSSPINLLILPDDRIIVPTGGGITAYTANGGIDGTFGTAGNLTVTQSYPEVFLDDQNRLLITTVTTGSLESVWRYLNTGVLDTSFGMNGWATFPPPTDFKPNTSGEGTAAARVQKDGRIILLCVGIGGEGAAGALVSRLWN